ncbi:hypothetical protein [Aquihabitans sp. McL0605]|uniref:hypothetical protein n=1 Tax=Aquihabitans sp. McL0605 TaxID=3415671 RepID=UPI003CEA5DBB
MVVRTQKVADPMTVTCSVLAGGQQPVHVRLTDTGGDPVSVTVSPDVGAIAPTSAAPLLHQALPAHEAAAAVERVKTSRGAIERIS